MKDELNYAVKNINTHMKATQYKGPSWEIIKKELGFIEKDKAEILDFNEVINILVGSIEEDLKLKIEKTTGKKISSQKMDNVPEIVKNLKVVDNKTREIQMQFQSLLKFSENIPTKVKNLVYAVVRGRFSETIENLIVKNEGRACSVDKKNYILSAIIKTYVEGKDILFPARNDENLDRYYNPSSFESVFEIADWYEKYVKFDYKKLSEYDELFKKRYEYDKKVYERNRKNGR